MSAEILKFDTPWLIVSDKRRIQIVPAASLLGAKDLKGKTGFPLKSKTLLAVDFTGVMSREW